MYFQRKHPGRSLRLLSALVLCVFVSHVVLDGFHHALVAHFTCLEHGEQLHAPSHSSHSHEGHESGEGHSHSHSVLKEERAGSEDKNFAIHSAPKTFHSHHECTLCFDTRKHIFLLCQKAMLLLSVSPFEGLLWQPIRVFISSFQSAYTLAPKQSPPRVSFFFLLS